MTAIPISQAREQLFPLVRQVNEDHTTVEIVSRNGDNAILMAADDYESLMETVYLLSTPANARWLMQSIAQKDAGETIPVTTDELREKFGIED